VLLECSLASCRYDFETWRTSARPPRSAEPLSTDGYRSTSITSVSGSTPS
jgi:hypothetical protein